MARFGAAVDGAHVAPELRHYILDLVGATRAHPDVSVGASPRAALSVLRAATAWAVADGRDYVAPDDVKAVAEPTLAHRIVAHPAAELTGATTVATIADILSRLVVPMAGG